MKEANLSSTNPQTKAMAMSNSYNFDFEGLKKETIEEVCHVSFEAHKKGEPYFVYKKLREYIVIAFSGSWSVDDWYAGKNPCGETKVDRQLFPSLRSIGNDEVATVNQAFWQRFRKIKEDKGKKSFCSKVENAVKDKKKIIFAGHSSGGSIAIFAATWFFEEYIRLKDGQTPHPFCLTFGSPLTADRIFCHAMRREKWSDYFINFVTRYDIVPLILFAPLSSIEDELPQVLSYFNPNSSSYSNLLPETQDIAKSFLTKVMENASLAAHYAACTLTGGTDDFLSTLCNYVDLSPYRPFGTYVYCSESGKSLAVKNPDAALQLLFYSSQLSSEEECPNIASERLKCHLAYKTQLRITMEMQNVKLVDKFQKLPIFLDNSGGEEIKAIDAVLNDLGLNERGRVSLHAAIEFEKQKMENQLKFEKLIPKKEDHVHKEEPMETLKSYKTNCDVTRGIGYYDSFRKGEFEDDFKANVARLEVAGIWDEIIEMLRRHELPDTFEGDKSWVERGTEFRCLVEPLDIANFYRHDKYVESGPYMEGKGRGKKYKYTQRWLEHSQNLPRDSCIESCFWAYLEQDLVNADNNNRVEKIEENLKKWYDEGLITKGDFSKDSTLVRWWNRFPEKHRVDSRIEEIIPRVGQLQLNAP